MTDEKKVTVKKTTEKNGKSTSARKSNVTTKKKSTSASSATKKASTSVKKPTSSSKSKNTTKKAPAKSTGSTKQNATTKKANVVKKEEKAVEEVKPIKVEVKEEVMKPVEVKTKKEETETCSILGTPLPLGNDKVDIDTRNKLYMKDALIFSFVIPVIDLFAMLFIKSYKPYPITNTLGINYLITLLIDFILIFILTFSVDYIHGERIVRKMNNKK